MISWRPGREIAYAVVTGGERAGVLTVRCDPSPSGTLVRVGYDLTALTAAARGRLGEFAREFPRMLLSWRRLAGDAPGRP